MPRSRRAKKLYTITRKLRGGQTRCMFIQPVDNEGLGNELYRYAMGLGALQPDMTLCKLPQKEIQHNPVKNYRRLFNGRMYNRNARVNAAKNVINPKNTPPEGNGKIPYASWQGYNYVEGAIDKVKDNLVRNEFRKFPERYTFEYDSSTTAFMHIRLKDYEETGWALPFSYYERALKRLFQESPSIERVLVVSDNIQKCKDYFHEKPKLIFIEGKDELQTLYMMMKCEAGAIISPSTFSSWGAMLGADRKQSRPPIIYPSPWLHFNEDTMNFPDWWIKLPTQAGGERPCIIVDLLEKEGLGNKLSSFAAALIVKEKANLPICIMNSTTPHSTTDYASLFDAEKIERPANMNSIKNVMKPRTNLSEFSKNVIDYNSSKNTGKNVKITPNLYQHFKSLLPVVSVIKEMLIRNEFGKEEYIPYHIKDGKSCAFMHIRLGDYVTRGWSLPESYFINALAELNKDARIQTIYVFTNEPGFCESRLETWKQKGTSKTIECKSELNELQTLYMMMQCRGGAILSGSTFSAWGALLGPNENPESVIIYPKEIPHFPGFTNPMSFPDRWTAV